MTGIQQRSPGLRSDPVAPMRQFLALSRTAFRRLHGLDSDELQTEPVECGEAAVWFAAARRHRVAGLWAAALPLPSLVPSLAEAWQRVSYGQALYTARLSIEAERIFTALRSSVDDLRLVKGPTLDAQAWPQPGIRSFDDLDFRCRRIGLPALTQGLRALGFRPVVEDPRRFKHLWHFGWGVSFRHADGLLIECNHRMFPPHYPFPNRILECAADAWRPLALDLATVSAPTAPQQLLLACLHSLWHGWERLVWVADIAGLLVRNPGVRADAERLVRRGGFARRALAVGCGVAERVFGPLPAQPQRAALEQTAVELALSALACAAVPPSTAAQRQMHLQLMRPGEAARYTLRRLATPGDPDFQQWHLPTSLGGLYWALRPLRLCHTNEGR